MDKTAWLKQVNSEIADLVALRTVLMKQIGLPNTPMPVQAKKVHPALGKKRKPVSADARKRMSEARLEVIARKHNSQSAAKRPYTMSKKALEQRRTANRKEKPAPAKTTSKK